MSDLTIEEIRSRLEGIAIEAVGYWELCEKPLPIELAQEREALTTALHALEENERLRTVEVAAWNHIHGDCGDTSELCDALAELYRWREGR